MDPSARSERAEPLDAEAFVRFCYRRRRVGWPDLYDEMCRVAHRGLFHGMGLRDLAEIGIGFSLQETSGLAAMVTRVVAGPRPPLGIPAIAAYNRRGLLGESAMFA